MCLFPNWEMGIVIIFQTADLMSTDPKKGAVFRTAPQTEEFLWMVVAVTVMMMKSVRLMRD